ncbi:SDR family NAD(P)-dependent oxidoreductase [Chloroflexota bacterium]
MKLKGKVAIITGAGSGMGEASAELFAREGVKVVVCDIDAKTGEEVVQKIKKSGGEATFLEVNVARSDDAKRMIEIAINRYGRLDILFNNAGIAGEPLEKTTEEKWRTLMDVNLNGPFLACMYAIPVMRKQGGGNILNMSSIAGIQSTGRSLGYSTSKAGLIMLTRILAKQLAKDNIRVNCLCPGPIDTPLTEALLGFPKTEEERSEKRAARLSRIPLGRVGHPEDVAKAALFLVSDDASFITGVALLVDGGVTV